MKFFKPDDFTGSDVNGMMHINRASDLANAKLEREGKIVFSQSSDRRYWEDPNDPTTQDASERSDLRALLINIEPIEPCTHLVEKIRQMNWCEPVEGFNRGLRVTDEVIFECECGARVKPKLWEEE